jgi:hypothetical protein
MYKGFYNLFERNVYFSAGLIFETVLLDVRNKMKNVFDELNMYEYYINGNRR